LFQIMLRFVGEILVRNTTFDQNTQAAHDMPPE
jgi:hypothetical protein